MVLRAYLPALLTTMLKKVARMLKKTRGPIRLPRPLGSRVRRVLGPSRKRFPLLALEVSLELIEALPERGWKTYRRTGRESYCVRVRIPAWIGRALDRRGRAWRTQL